MEPILLYGFPAGSSMGLVATLEWLGKPYRLCRVDMLGEMRQPPFSRINPRVETPVLITDRGHVLTETLAIANWLATRDSENAISFEPETPEQDRMVQLMAYLNTGFTGAFGPLWTAMELPDPDPVYERYLRRLGQDAVIDRHDKLEQMIGDTQFLIADHPTLADGVLVGVARWLDVHKVAPRERWPKLHTLRQRIEATPAAQFALAVERGEAATGSGALRGQIPLGEIIAQFGTSSP